METNTLAQEITKITAALQNNRINGGRADEKLYTLFSDACAKLLDWYETTPLYTIKELNEDSSWSDITNYFITNIYKQ